MLISNNVSVTTPVVRPPVTPRATPPAEPKERFVSSDMGQMLDDMERNGVLPAAVRTETAPAVPQRPEPHGEMALMLENIQRAEESYQAANLTGVKAQATGQGSNPTTLMMLEDTPEPEHSHHPAHKAHHGELGTHLGLEVGEHVIHSASHATEAATHVAHETATEATAEVAEGATQTAAHGAAAIGASLAAAAGIGAASCGALGVVMLHTGLKEIKQGLQAKDAEHTLEGVGNTIVGVRSGLAGVTLAGMLAHGSEVVSAVAGGAQLLLAPLGVAHGAIDIGLGTKDIVQGVRHKDQPKIVKGALSVGLGGALTAAALGGGIPALVVAGVFLGGKVVQGIRQKHATEHAQENSSKAS